MNTGKQRPGAQAPTAVKRCFSAIPGGLLVLALSGCSLKGGLIPDGLSASNIVEPERPAFHFESGTLELGDFNYEEIKDDLFSPCEEISAEEFAAIGFETLGGGITNNLNQVNACGLSSKTSPRLDMALTGGPSRMRDVRAERGLWSEDASSVLPNVYTYGSGIAGDNICLASVDTTRGQLGSVASNLDGTVSPDELCETAVQLIDSLYLL